MKLTSDFTAVRVAKPWPQKVCPKCNGPIPDLFAELTDDPNGVETGKVSIDCYYCGVWLQHSGPSYGGVLTVVETPGLRRRRAKRDQVNTGAITFEEMVARYQEGLINNEGKRPFEGYQWV
jgi:hypothetical protein